MANNLQTYLDEFFMLQWQQAGVDLPLRAITNVIGGAVLTDDPVNEATLLQLSGIVLSGVPAAYPSGVMLAAFERAWVDGSGGLVPIVAPALSAGAQFGVCDGKKGGSFSGTGNGASIANGAHTIEDPNNPGTYTTNPIKMTLPSQSAVWECDPTGTFYKLVGG